MLLDSREGAPVNLSRAPIRPTARPVPSKGRRTTQVLITQEAIARRVSEMGEEISRDYLGRAPILIGILKGAVVFLSDLVRAITCDVEIDFISISSYGDGTASTGTVRLLKDLDLDVTDRDVLVVEDIVDSGLTLDYIRRILSVRSPRSLSIAALLDKRDRRTLGIYLDYVGFHCPDAYVVGYGLDLNEQYRGLPYVACLNEAESGAGPAAG